MFWLRDVTRRFCFAAAVLAFACSGHAQELHPEIITGPKTTTSFDERTGEMIITEGARLVYGDASLAADEIRYNRVSGVAAATGHAIFTQGSRRILADKLTYHLADGTYVVENLRFGEYPIYGTAASATGTRTQINLNDAKLSYGEPGPWQPTVDAGKLTYGPGDRIRAESGGGGGGGGAAHPGPQNN
jgi:LPS-assembly protein